MIHRRKLAEDFGARPGEAGEAPASGGCGIEARSASHAGTIVAIGARALLGVAWTAPQLVGREVLVERDALPFILPTRAFLARAIEAGSPPWWNPAPVLGKPFFAATQTAAAYPPSLLLAGGSIAGGLGRRLTCHLWIGGAGMIAWLGAAGLSPAAAAVGGVAWTFGGAMLSATTRSRCATDRRESSRVHCCRSSPRRCWRRRRDGPAAPPPEASPDSSRRRAARLDASARGGRRLRPAVSG